MSSKKPNILVIGDLMIDNYLWGEANRISPEAPVQIVDIYKETTVLGGAGNVVNNLVALGADVTIMSVIGNDKNANELISMLDDINVKHYLVVDEDRKTTKKSRIIASHQQVIRFDSETKDKIDDDYQVNIGLKLIETVHEFDLIILSDYGKGVLANDLIRKVVFSAKGANLKVLVDPKGDNYTKYTDSFLLTPNKKELEKITNIKINSDENLKDALLKLKNITSVQIPMVTLSEDGIAILDENDNIIVKPTKAKEVYDVTGAGDTVISSLGYSLVKDDDISKAMEFANLAAGVVVGKLGSATATLKEIQEH
jgi:D-beta-D-heptose 7-phosphate kinase/D-beta-D-heptose 1-phosphate adenosyltransferase